FSSRRRHTRSKRDWSSDVCSSDLEYILQKFSYASESSEKTDETDKTEKKTEPSLKYEVEYILAGKSSDKENLESVLFKIFLIRMSLNYICLLGESSLKAQADVMAAVISI